MKLAIPYENGMIFQHFGKCAAFKYYEADANGDFTACHVKTNDGQGHGALAQILKENGVDVVICGGIGDGAQQALSENGIRIFAGNSGNADTAAILFLAGKLEQKDGACDHHDHHGDHHDCDEHGCR